MIIKTWYKAECLGEGSPRAALVWFRPWSCENVSAEGDRKGKTTWSAGLKREADGARALIRA
jgi:hypothetical protein